MAGAFTPHEGQSKRLGMSVLQALQAVPTVT
jgi:hypothetical protein